MHGVAQPPLPALRRVCGCFMVGNSAAAAICTISGMTALGIKCNKADCKRRGRGTEWGNKRELVRLDDHLGGKEGEWVTALVFCFFYPNSKERMPHTFTQTSEQKSHTAAFGGLLFVFTGVAKKGTDLRFPHSRLFTLHIQFLVNTRWSLSASGLSPSGL